MSTPHTRPSDTVSRRTGVLIGATWVAIGVVGCVTSAWISTLALASPLRFLIVAFIALIALAVWFRVLRALGAVDRGIFGTITSFMDDAMGVGDTRR